MTFVGLSVCLPLSLEIIAFELFFEVNRAPNALFSMVAKVDGILRFSIQQDRISFRTLKGNF